MNTRRGFTLIEVLIALLVIGIITMLAMGSFISFRRAAILQADTNKVLSVLQDARSRALSAEFNLSYGVHIGTSTVTLFQGTTYATTSSTNVAHALTGNATEIASYYFGSASADIVFGRATGFPNATGTVVVRLIDYPDHTKTIQISQSGIAEIVTP